MIEIFLNALKESIQITLLVLVMMVIVDLINVWTRGKLSTLLKKPSKWRQYSITSFLGAVPGCAGAFAGASLYMHGMISFGAITGGMLASSGDEAYVMLAMFPKTALIIFGILFVIGTFSGKIIDWFVKKFNIKTCNDCGTQIFHKAHEGYLHYLKEHVWHHIIKKHVWKVFLWTFGALLFLGFGLSHFDLHRIVSHYTLLILILSAVIGLIPESGPHLIFVTLFASGLIPFSVLLTSSMVQDGHGLLPLLSYSVKDSVKIKVFNLFIGLSIGLALYLIGI